MIAGRIAAYGPTPSSPIPIISLTLFHPPPHHIPANPSATTKMEHDEDTRAQNAPTVAARHRAHRQAAAARSARRWPPAPNKSDFIAFACGILPIGAVAYACIYAAMRRSDSMGEAKEAGISMTKPNAPPERTETAADDFANFMLYGFIQFTLGSIAGYCAARWIHLHRGPRPAEGGEERTPLLAPPPAAAVSIASTHPISFADTAEAPAA